jgi:prepilin-type N-terminal cleavage/methylation domain-containing protein/prepilin-type processing-associated H-X9-DG protein
MVAWNKSASSFTQALNWDLSSMMRQRPLLLDEVATRRWRPKQGFTLIELLVVIALITLLASILLPALARAKASAKSARCRSNLRQLILALGLYVDDSEAKYPHAMVYGPVPNSPNSQFSWMDALRPYTASDWTNDVYHCPANQNATTPEYQLFDGLVQVSPVGSYGYNGVGTSLHTVPTGEAYPSPGLGGHLFLGAPEQQSDPIPEAAVLAPADMIAFGDSPDGWFILTADPKAIYPFGTEFTALVHRTGANTAFCDGHVDFLKSRDLYVGTDTVLRRWNHDHEPHPEYWK